MFAYCNNCPVIFSDHTGHISKYSSVALFEGGGGANDRYVYEYIYETQDGAKTGKVYIYTGKSDAFMRSGEALPEGFSVGTDIIILDLTRGKPEKDNPNIRAYNSYLISNAAKMIAIIDVLCGYAGIYAKNWGRTNDKDSLYIEWDVHNSFALFDDSAKHVDFDFDERGEYRVHFYWKAITSGLEKLWGGSTN